MLSDTLKDIRRKNYLNQTQFANRIGVTQSAVSQWENGLTRPNSEQLRAISDSFGISIDDLLQDGFIPITKSSVPIIGQIACGQPITAQQNIDGYADLPDGVSADFALKCVGDSMEPTFEHGDLVLIKQTPDVSNGQIAAVGIDGEATLKRIYRQNETIMCVSENPAYAPMVFPAQDVTIYGLAVGYVRLW